MRDNRALEIGTGCFVLLGFAALLVSDDAAAVEWTCG
jgi:hypothetical protein